MSDQVPAVWQRFAEVCGLDGDAGRAREILQSTIMPKGTAAEVSAFVAVCSQYQLNPLRREIYAFPTKGGGIQPVVGVDGWLAIANRNPDHDAIDTEEIFDEGGKFIAVKASIWKKGSARPTTATEYLAECFRDTEPWRRWPRRMTTNKAIIQGIRRAYAVSGIMEQDEAERADEAEWREVKRTTTHSAIIDGAKAVVAEAGPELDDEPPLDPEDVALWSSAGDPEGA